MKFMITCANWLSHILIREITKFWYKILEEKSRVVYFEGDDSAIYNINLWSRVWNKLFLELADSKADNFNDIFNVLNWIDRQNILNIWNPILVKVDSKNSKITSIPSIQSVGKKAIVKKLAWDKRLTENPDLPEIEIYLFLEKDRLKVFLNTSWDNLFKRWYRKNMSQAPLKESLAAWLVLLSNWNFSKDFYDMFCGSGVIGIEAWLIAKNIAPWINRNFAFEHLKIYDQQKFKKIKSDSITQVYTWKKHNIIISDIDPEMVKIAKENVKNAWVEDIVTVTQKDFRDYENEKLEWTLVSNPPYGVRLKDAELKGIYKDLINIFEKNQNLYWCIFTSFEWINDLTTKHRKSIKMFNGDLETYLYRKIKE